MARSCNSLHEVSPRVTYRTLGARPQSSHLGALTHTLLTPFTTKEEGHLDQQYEHEEIEDGHQEQYRRMVKCFPFPALNITPKITALTTQAHESQDA